MNADLDQTLAFDESCAREEMIVRRNPPPLEAEPDTVAQNRLSRLDVYMWILCFLFGTLFGRQILPAIEALCGVT